MQQRKMYASTLISLICCAHKSYLLRVSLNMSSPPPFCLVIQQSQRTWVTPSYLEMKTMENRSSPTKISTMRSMATGCPRLATASTKHVSRQRPSGGWERTPPGTLAGGTLSAITEMWSREPRWRPPAPRASCWTESRDWARAEVCQRKVRRSY